MESYHTSSRPFRLISFVRISTFQQNIYSKSYLSVTFCLLYSTWSGCWNNHMLQIVGIALANRHAVKPSRTVYLVLHRIVRFCPMQTSLLGTSTPVIIGVLSDMPCARFPNRGCRLRFNNCGGEEIRPLWEPCFLQRERDPPILQNYPG